MDITKNDTAVVTDTNARQLKVCFGSLLIFLCCSRLSENIGLGPQAHCGLSLLTNIDRAAFCQEVAHINLHSTKLVWYDNGPVPAASNRIDTRY